MIHRSPPLLQSKTEEYSVLQLKCFVIILSGAKTSVENHSGYALKRKQTGHFNVQCANYEACSVLDLQEHYGVLRRKICFAKYVECA